MSGQPNTLQQRGSRWLSGIAVSSAAMAYGLIIFGSQVRVSDSGMGCPDWPLCEGKVGPLQELHALMEQTHRYLAATVTVLVLTTAILAWLNRSRSAAIRPALFTVAVIVVQIGLGALTVIAGNGAPTVAAHLIAALAMLAGATITAVAALVPLRPTTGRRLGRLGWTAISAAGVLLVSGSLVVNAEAEKACASFPLCPSDQPSGMVALHLIHRAVAVLAGTALLTFAVHAWRHWSVSSAARALAAGLVALVVATACLGIVSALLKAPPGWQDLHLAGAAAVLAVSMALATLGWLTGADSRPAEGPETDRPVPAKPAASTCSGITSSLR